MVVAIMGMMASITLFAFGSMKRDESLRAPALDLETFARRASRSATSLNQEFRIGFAKEGFYVFAGQNPDHIQLEHRLDPRVEMRIKRWNVKKWIKPDGEIWVFPPTGVSEPISVRFSQGEAYVELDFNPLTGAVDEERALLP